MKPWIIPAIFLLFLLIAPAMGQSVTWTAPADKAAVNIYIVSNEGTTGDITFYFDDGTTKSGSWSYVTTADLWDYSLIRKGTITLEGESSDRDFVITGQLYTMFYHVPGVANATSNRLSGYMDQSKIAFWPSVEVDTPASPIIRFTINADAPVEYWVDTAGREAQKGMLASSDADWIAKIMGVATSTFWSAYDFITNLIYWLKFFFIDNLGLIIVLYISVSMALAARAARGNIGRFYSRFITQQVKLIEFIFSVWRMLIELIGTIRGWFRV